MSMFKKAALFSAISVISSGAFALQAMDDAGLADATGQSGLTITTTLNVTGAVMSYTDTDGLGSTSAASSAGSLNIHNLGLSSSTQAITTNIDVGSNSSGQAVMQIQTSIPTLAVSFDGIDLTSSPAAVGSTSKNNFIVTQGTQSITMSGLNLNMQLGDTSPQGHMMILSDAAPTSLTLGNTNGTATNQVVLVDAANKTSTSTPGIGIGGLAITGLDFGSSATATNNTTVDATTAGLVVAFGSSAMNNVNVTMTNVSMGETCAGVASGCGAATAPIGNISISGLNLAGTSVTIRGH